MVTDQHVDGNVNGDGDCGCKLSMLDLSITVTKIFRQHDVSM